MADQTGIKIDGATLKSLPDQFFEEFSEVLTTTCSENMKEIFIQELCSTMRECFKSSPINITSNVVKMETPDDG